MRPELKQKVLEYNRKVANNQAIVDLVNEAGGIKTRFTQSDKLGFDWKCFYVNDILVRRDYIMQEVMMGTAENPIEWTESVVMVPNAYYVFEDVRKVWTGESGVTAEWDDERFEAF